MRSVADRVSGTSSSCICHTPPCCTIDAALDEIVEQFVDQQRRPARPRGDGLVDPGRDVATEMVGHDGVDRRPIEPTEPNRRRPGARRSVGEELAQLGPAIGFVGARGDHQQQRRVGQIEAQVLQHLEARLVGPVEIVEREDHRLVGADPGDQRGEGILRPHLERLGSGGRWLQVEPLDQRPQRGQSAA